MDYTYFGTSWVTSYETGEGVVSEIKDKYSVGEAARLSNVSTKTLRYYDEIQLIIPDIDENNNYRYYTKCRLEIK